ncbi:MAG: two-component sensor histidine kinase [Hyphomonadaceae bacterium]|nr:two-component sensor histidine kinase [Hyphomonadaceae bacterium]
MRVPDMFISRWSRPVLIGVGAVCASALVLELAGAGRGWTLLALFLATVAAGAALWLEGAGRAPAATVVEAPATPGAPDAEKRLGDLAPLIEALPEATLLVDRDGRVVASNREARRQLQFEAQGLRLSAILRHPEILDASHDAAVDGVTRVVEYENAAPVEEHFRVYVAPIAWGEDTAALMIFHDQTTHIVTERMRADFLANASHELKTPVTSISLLIETLGGAARDDGAARERFLGLMEQQVDRMRRLIDDLLSLSKIEINEHVPPNERADMVLIAREAADAMATVARGRGVTVELVSEAAAHHVTGDRFQLTQVAQNLIDNAVKYSNPDGVVTVEIGVADGREAAADMAARRWPEASRISLLTPGAPASRRYVFLRVSDQGPGIPRRHLPRLSERFFRVERDQQAVEREGTGLGLAIVKHIVNRHRGGFAVESEPGRGSAFAIYLEQARPDAGGA